MLKSFFLENYRTKIISVLLASMLWWFVYVNHHPRDITSYSVRVVYTNLADGHELAAPQDMLKLRLQGDPQQISQVSPATVWAEATLKGMKQGTHEAPLKIINKTDVRILSVPDSIPVTLKSTSMSELPISVDFSGKLQSGFSLGDLSYRPRKARVFAEERVLEQVASLSGRIALNDRNESFRENAALIALDAAGKRVLGVIIEPSKISVSVPVLSENSKSVPVSPEFKSGATLKDYPMARFVPASVKISGAPDVISSIRSIRTELFDLSLCMGGGQYTLQLSLPKGVHADSTQIAFDCNPENISNRTLLIEVHTVNACSRCTVETIPAEIQVGLEGPPEPLNAASKSDISAVVDLAGLDPGDHTAEPRVSLRKDLAPLKLTYTPSPVKIKITGPGD